MSNAGAPAKDAKRKVPRHVAIIMDGNGRWARQRGLARTAGHRQGVEAVKAVSKAAREAGVEYLTLFGFSSENWQRPVDEVSDLMGLLRLYLRSETAELHKQGVRLRVIGDRSRLDDDIATMIANAEALTASNSQGNLTVALSYGGRDEIVRAAQAMARKVAAGEVAADEIDAGLFETALMTCGLPDPDLLIRTSGEQRISNFLLWQCAYTEFYFTDTLWPDFNGERLHEALNAFAGRERRFGLTGTTGR